MKAVFYFLKREFASVLLTLFSLLPLFFIGSLLDILLIHFYAGVENGKTALPLLSRWLFDAVAGHRFLCQEIMVCFWLLMVLCLIANALMAQETQQFRIRFIYALLFIWGLSLTAAAVIALACVLPWDLLLARVNGNGLFSLLIRMVLLLELALIVLTPVGVLIWRRTRNTR